MAYSNYAARFGRSQSLEELARRGGFCPYEMDDQLPGWREIEAARGDLERENAELKSQLATDKERLNYAEGIIREQEAQILRLTEEARGLREAVRRLTARHVLARRTAWWLRASLAAAQNSVRMVAKLARSERTPEARTDKDGGR